MIEEEPLGDMWFAFGINVEAEDIAMITLADNQSSCLLDAKEISNSVGHVYTEIKAFNLVDSDALYKLEQWMLGHGVSKDQAIQFLGQVLTTLREFAAKSLA